MKRHALALGLALVSALAVACTSSGDAAEVTVEPWIVTGTELSLLGDGRYTVEVTYTAPGGSGRWLWTVSRGANAAEQPWYQCWRTARIGGPLPSCMRSPNDLSTATP